MAAAKKEAESPKKEPAKKAAPKNNAETAAEAPKKETAKKTSSKKAAEPVEDVAKETVKKTSSKKTAEPAEEAPKESAKKTSSKKEPAEAKPKAEPAAEEPKEPAKKSAPKKQYIVWREEDQKWAVKKEGSDKATRLFRTKAEAEEYARGIAEKQGTRVVRQKKDGKFQKEKY